MEHTHSTLTSEQGYIFTLPDIGEGVAEGEVLAWLANQGDEIKEDQPLLEVMTDKVTVEIPAPRAGYLARQFVGVGDIVPVGAALVEITANAPGLLPVTEQQEAVPEVATPPAPIVKQTSTIAPTPAKNDLSVLPVPAVAVQSPVTGQRVLAAPATRQKAKMLGVNLCQVSGTGPHGRVTLEDVERHTQVASQQGSLTSSVSWNTQPPMVETRRPYTGLRKRIGERLLSSTQQIPSFALVEEVRMSNAETMRAELKPLAEAQATRLTPLAFIAKATCIALAEFPSLNSSLNETGTEITEFGHIHLGVAVDVEQGLMVPVIENAHRLSLFELASRIQYIGQQAKAGELKSLKLSGGTFTISSIGSIGGLFGIPIINPPEAAILGVNQLRKVPVVNESNAIVVAEVLNLSLSADHRIVDGATTARFMNRIKFLLQNPSHLLV